MEISLASEDDGLSGLDALPFIRPLSRDLEGGLYGLCPGVHREHHIIAKHFRDEFSVGTEFRVIKRPRGEGELGCMSDHCLHDLGVAVALIDGSRYSPSETVVITNKWWISRVRAQHVNILIPFRVPNSTLAWISHMVDRRMKRQEKGHTLHLWRDRKRSARDDSYRKPPKLVFVLKDCDLILTCGPRGYVPSP